MMPRPCCVRSCWLGEEGGMTSFWPSMMNVLPFSEWSKDFLSSDWPLED